MNFIRFTDSTLPSRSALTATLRWLMVLRRKVYLDSRLPAADHAKSALVSRDVYGISTASTEENPLIDPDQCPLSLSLNVPDLLSRWQRPCESDSPFNQPRRKRYILLDSLQGAFCPCNGISHQMSYFGLLCAS